MDLASVRVVGNLKSGDILMKGLLNPAPPGAWTGRIFVTRHNPLACCERLAITWSFQITH
jgi:hypothetical protein